MLISHRKRFIYTKTLKTAGTSVESYFEPYCMPEGAWQFSHHREQYVSPAGIIGYRGKERGGSAWYNHMPAAEIKEKIGPEIWDAYYKFCVVRNPFDKLISSFHFSHLDPNGAMTDAEQVRTFRSWIKAKALPRDANRWMIGSTVCMDYLIRYEALETGLRQVCAALGIDFDPQAVPRLKSGFRNPRLAMSDYYDDETRAIVSDLYAVELRVLDYSFPATA